jgi:pimeloyl-ACP methyl ester carboxylesterase
MNATDTTMAVPTDEPSTHSSVAISRDGSTIAFDRVGDGPAVILITGALCSRSLGPGVKLAPELAREFTVLTYDRRGRGQSCERGPYAVEREIEDLDALICKAGGSAFVFGYSSGAVLALAAAARGLPIRKLALYEPPVIIDGSRPSTEDDWARITAALAAGGRGDAVKVFLRSVGVPGFVSVVLRWTPMWPRLTAVAHTLPHDGAIMGELQQGKALPAGIWGGVTAPALVIAGGKSPAWMHQGARAVAGAVPGAQYRVLEGQTHDVKARAVAPVLREFFGVEGS